MPDSKYWRKRFTMLEEAQNKKGAKCYAEIEKHFRCAQREIEMQIEMWYARFADNNDVSMAEARRLLNSDELKELKWDIQQYIKAGRENAVDQRWMKELENASARHHITWLEALKLRTQQSLEVLYGNMLDSIDATMRDVYKDGYYHTAYEIQKGFSVGWDFAALDDKKISKVIKNPWAADGKIFSERVWENRTKLVNEVQNALTKNIILGVDPQKAINEIAKKMGASKNVAGRLVMTEEAFFSSAAQRDCFKDLDVEQYEIVATLDTRTSDICREMDGKHFPMDEYTPGVSAPPFHCYCRSTTVPYFEDYGERAARGADGKTYYVPADMTYKDWEKTFVE